MEITNVQAPVMKTANEAGQATVKETGDSFQKAMSEAMSKVNEAQLESDRMTEKLVTGEADNLHDVMIAAEKGSVYMQTATEVRNKAVEAYKEMMRMQV